jgi:hypothetical protein
MITFYSPANSVYVTTNYKVMFSTLYYSDELVRLRFRELILQKIYERLGLKTRRQHFLLVRNPYLKLESFFINKFRTIVNEDQLTHWEECQQLFFPFLKIELNHSYETIKQRFLNCTFSEFIEILPEVYLRDGHLIPQYFSESIKLSKKGIGIGSFPIKYTSILKIESPETMRFLFEEIGIDIQKRLNPSKSKNEDLEWTPKLREIVNRIYQKDFQNYNYDLIH